MNGAASWWSGEETDTACRRRRCTRPLHRGSAIRWFHLLCVELVSALGSEFGFVHLCECTPRRGWKAEPEAVASPTMREERGMLLEGRHCTPRCVEEHRQNEGGDRGVFPCLPVFHAIRVVFLHSERRRGRRGWMLLAASFGGRKGRNSRRFHPARYTPIWNREGSPVRENGRLPVPFSRDWHAP